MGDTCSFYLWLSILGCECCQGAGAGWNTLSTGREASHLCCQPTTGLGQARLAPLYCRCYASLAALATTRLGGRL